MPHDILYRQEITATLHKKAAHAMSREYMNSAMLFDSRQFLVIHEHAIDTLTFPTSTKVSVKQWLAFINYKRCTDFQITPEVFAQSSVMKTKASFPPLPPRT